MAVSVKRRQNVVNSSPIYYGWVVWFVAMIGAMATSPGQSYSVSLFFDFFIEDFGLDRTTASSLYGAGTFISSLTLVWVGRKLDLLGNRRMGVIVGALFAVVLILCSLINGPIMLLFAFAGIRGLGQGSLSLVSSTGVANWFKLRRGRMMALMAIGSALFQGIYVNGLRILLETMDWRQVFVVLGLGVGIVIVPLFGFLMRNKPEDYGLLPDNEQADKLKDDEIAEIEEDNWTLKEAMRTPILWIFLFAKLIPSAWGTGLILHQVSLFNNLNHAPQTATEVFALMAMFSAGFALMIGFLVDKFKPSYIVALQMTAMLTACVLSTLMTETWLLIVYAMAFGLVMGVGGVFDGAVWANLYGRKYQGEVRGFVFTSSVVGSAIGPTLFGLSYDYAGGYTFVLWAGVVLCGIAIVLSLLAPDPKREIQVAASPVV
jgi:MFS family permease